MIHDFLQFSLAHPLADLVGAALLAGCWLTAAFISVIPPLPANSSWWVQWAYACAQIFGASLDKVGHAALQTRYARQFEQQLADGTSTKSVETTATTVNPTNQGASL